MISNGPGARVFLARVLLAWLLGGCSASTSEKVPLYSQLLDSQAETAVPVSPADFVIVNQDTSTYAAQG